MKLPRRKLLNLTAGATVLSALAPTYDYNYSKDSRPTKWGSGVRLHGSNSEPLMSALGQKRTFGDVRPMSAFPQKRTLIEQVGMSALCQKETCRQ